VPTEHPHQDVASNAPTGRDEAPSVTIAALTEAGAREARAFVESAGCRVTDDGAAAGAAVVWAEDAPTREVGAALRAAQEHGEGLAVVLCLRREDGRAREILAHAPLPSRVAIVRTPCEPTDVLQLVRSLAAGPDGAPLHAQNAVLRRRLAESRRHEEALRHDALHDPLTRLPNRALLLDRLTQCVERMKRSPGSGCAVLFIDIDNFKLINDSYGHKTGDAVLIEVASRIEAAVRTCDTIGRPLAGMAGRLGGDEFIVLLEDVADPSQAILVTRRLQEMITAPLTVDGRVLHAGASMGVAIGTPEHTPEELLREADTAMYRAKYAGKARHAVFDHQMHKAVLERLTIEADLRGACDRGEMDVVYQPIVRLESGALAGFEALVRWNHPTRGPLMPESFIPIAEESGQIDRLGAWVIERVARQVAEWRASLPTFDGMYVSVNVSRVQLVDPCFAERFEATLARAGVPGKNIHVEVTETTVMKSEGEAIKALARLRKNGTLVMLDDFGTGYSSLSCLHRFPIDVLKIDRSFVETMRHNSDYAAVVNAVVALAHNLRVKVIAEGVESTHHMVQLQALGCDLAQGFLFARPATASRATAMIAEGISWSRRAA